MGIFFKRFFATIFGFLTAVIIFLAAAAAMLYYAVGLLTPSERVIKSGTVLEIDLRNNIIDTPEPLNISQLISMTQSSGDASSTLLSTIKALQSAATDPNIAAISLRASGTSPISLANGEELREALIEFKSKSEKPIYAFGDSFSQLEYYIASASDKITLAPLGAVEWQGVAINTMFYAPLMNRLGIKTEVFRPASCTYKSAIEPFTRSNMSAESREQSERIVEGFWSGIVTEVAAARNISEQELKDIAYETIIVESKSAIERGIIDSVLYLDQYNDLLAEKAGAKVSSSNDSASEERKGEIRKISLSSYISVLESREAANKSKVDLDIDLSFGSGKLGNKIGVIYVDGAIVDGPSKATEGSVGSSTLIAQLRKARLDNDYCAVVVRVNSPGGSALAADNIWREMELLKERKSLIVSMGAYAASGGYYISAPADLIIADRFTLTGSIGVYGVMFNAEDALQDKLYINQQSVGSSPSADFGRATRPITALERAAVMRGVDDVYAAFIDRVAVGRKLSPAIIKALSGGRVWSGEDAASCNLVDEIGGLSASINAAVSHSGADANSYELEEVAGQDSNQWLEYAARFSTTIGKSFAAALLPSFATNYEDAVMRDLKVIEAADRGIVMIAPERVKF